MFSLRVDGLISRVRDVEKIQTDDVHSVHITKVLKCYSSAWLSMVKFLLHTDVPGFPGYLLDNLTLVLTYEP